MPSVIVLGGNSITLNPKKMIGSGGEADIYKIDNDIAVKIYKPPNHPDYAGQPHEQKAAKERIEIHQRKLRDYPKNLPPKMVTPIDIATDPNTNLVVGYAMLLVKKSEVLMRYSEQNYRAAGISNDMVGLTFRDLHSTVDLSHRTGLVIGDFNDLNVLVANIDCYIIDSDSCQWGPYFCNVFTSKFVDPLICDPKGSGLMMIKPHSAETDWYAFSVMLMQSLLFVDPYGGVFKPKNLANRMPHSARPLHRITVFNPEVVYPKPATPYGVLPDDLLQWFHKTFEKDYRGTFPLNLLDNLRWTKCSKCGTEHARGVCPNCALTAPQLIKEVVQVRGKVVATRIFSTSGKILFATYQDGKMKYLYQDDGYFKREDGSTVVAGTSDPLMRFRISGDTSLLAFGNQMIALTPNEANKKISTDTFGTLPMFDANERFYYWTQGGQLKRNDTYGDKYMGDVLENQTLFWVGSNFGFGFYRAGGVCVAFVFDAEHQGINDSVKLPRITGQLIDSTCVFAKDRCWFFVSTRQGGKTINQCFVIKRDGTVLGSASGEAGDGTWLGSIRGRLAANNYLLAAIDEGIVLVETNGSGEIVKVREYPDTEPFVDSGCYLFPGQDCIHVVKSKEVWTLKIS